MCGIFVQSGIRDLATAQRSAATFVYRGPDGTQTSFSSDTALVQHRLAIIDPRAVADQPYWNDAGTVGVVFNGEIYNFRSLRERHFPGARWRTEGDTEVLLRLYEKLGQAFVRELDGMYAIVVLDQQKRKIHAFRDPFGIKPLYYAKAPGGVVCASEVKGVVSALRSAGAPITTRAGMLDTYVTLGYIPSPATLIEGVLSLMPGATLSYDLETHALSIQNHPLFVPDIEPVTDPIAMLADSVIRHTIADVPIGLFLSGGIDSTFIAHVLSRESVDFTAFTLDIPGRNDAEYAARVAAHFGIPHAPLTLTPERFEESYAIVRERTDQPTADSSIIPTLVLARHARESVKVVLSGEGADEIFLGYGRHTTLARLTRSRNAHARFLASSNLPLRVRRALAATLRDPYTFYALAAGIMPMPAGITQFADRSRADEISPVDFDLKYYLENDLLRKIDLGTMYASLEGRVPFCSPVVLASARSDERALLAGGQPKASLKARLAQVLPHDIVYRPKSGFSIPFADLSRTSDLVKEDAQALPAFMRSAFSESKTAAKALEVSERNHYVRYALLALMHSYRNLGL